MKKKLLSVAVGMVALSGLAFASGPMHFFDDVESGSGVWFEEAVYDMMYKGVFEAKDNFNPNGLVNRAEMAVMLDRLYDAIVDPKGSYWEWETYDNDYYSVAYPNKYLLGLRDGSGELEFYAKYNDSGFEDDDCSSDLSGVGDYTWNIWCEDLDGGETVMDVIDDFTSSWDDRNISIEEVDFNGGSAYKVVMVSEEGYWGEYVFMADEERSYRFYGASRPYDADFERYWMSFMLK
jgi:hypothetical protein